MKRETKTAVKTLARRPMMSVTANPLTGPVPYMKRKKAEARVVTWVSMMVTRTRPNPASMAERTVLPRLSSSRILSKIRTLESTDIPTVRISPAIPAPPLREVPLDVPAPVGDHALDPGRVDPLPVRDDRHDLAHVLTGDLLEAPSGVGRQLEIDRGRPETVLTLPRHAQVGPRDG